MSFIAKNPLTIPEVESSPSVPQAGTRGLFAGKDGWYDVDSNEHTRRIATEDDITNIDDSINAKINNAYKHYGDAGISPTDASLFKYVMEGNTWCITGYTGTDTDVVIPYEINDISVTSIGDWAFWSNTALSSVTIPNSVTTIAGNVFRGCSNLKSVTIPDSVTTIGDDAFMDCESLKSITIPDSVTTIPIYMFYNCTSLVNIAIPDSVTSIGTNAFSGCGALVVICNQGSYAEDYCKTNNIKYVLDTVSPDSLSVSLDNYYTKQQVDDKLENKADKSELPKKVSELENDAKYVTENRLKDTVISFDGYVKDGYHSDNEVDNIIEEGVYKLCDSFVGASLSAILVVSYIPVASTLPDGSIVHTSIHQTLIDQNGISKRDFNIDENKWGSWVRAYEEITNVAMMKADKSNTYTKQEVKDYVGTQTEILKADIEGIQEDLHNEAHFRGYLSTNAKIQALEATPNDFAYSAESGTKWVYDSENGWLDTEIPVPDQLTPASVTTPLINGVASVGTENAYARGDHRHPTDTTRLSVEEFNEFKSELELGLDRIIAIQNSLIGGGSE